MKCPHCLKDQKGFDYFFCHRFNICYECISREAKGMADHIAIDMVNEVLAWLKEVRTRV